jgi:hypothetical protein
MTVHRLRIASDAIRAKARAWVDAAPIGCLIRFYPEPKRTDAQNDKMWAMLGDISKQCQLHGKSKLPETWKFVMMHALKYECAFEIGLNGDPFPVGYKSSQLSAQKMSELIEYIYSYGAEQGVMWSEKGYDL